MSRSAKSKAALDPFAEAAALGKRLAEGVKLFQEVRDEDVQIATSEKDVIWQQDKVTLYRYRSLSEQKVRTPVLIVYGLIGRYTMADLQEDRSLVRNLLKLGVDLYVVDWGNPSRADRFVTLDDYIDGYLAECVNVISEANGGGEDQSTRDLRGWDLHNLLRGAAPRGRQRDGADDHADRLPRRHCREPQRSRLHQHVDAQP